jgi:hypothetical protein
MVDGRRVGGDRSSHPRQSTVPDASQRDTLFPILASMRKPKIARASLGTSAMMHAAGSHVPGATDDEAGLIGGLMPGRLGN